MGSKYSVIQYLPNPIAQERINIGIVAFDESHVKTRFVKSWKRISCFATNDNDIEFLEKFKLNMQKLASMGLLFSDNPNDNAPNLERLNKVAKTWNNSVQFTEPRGSLDDPETLLDDIAEDFLLEPPSPKPSLFRDRQAAVRATRKKIKLVVDSFGKEAKEFYKKDYKLQGELGSHKCDIAVANGKVFLAAQAISFEVKTNELAINSTSWLISDVKKIDPKIPIGVVMFPPKEEFNRFEQSKKLYNESKSIYESLKAEIIHENDVESWTYDRLGKEFASLLL